MGTKNPTVKLYSVNLSGLTVGQPATKNEISAPDDVKGVENVITAVAWQNNETVISVWMNRVQNRAYLQSCINSNCNMVYDMCKLIIYTQRNTDINFSSSP